MSSLSEVLRMAARLRRAAISEARWKRLYKEARKELKETESRLEVVREDLSDERNTVAKLESELDCCEFQVKHLNAWLNEMIAKHERVTAVEQARKAQAGELPRDDLLR